MSTRPPCIDHLTLPVADLKRSVRFYRAVLVDGMGWREDVIDGRPTFGPKGSEDVSLQETEQPIAPLHLAFSASSRTQVAAFHASGLSAGGRDNGEPGVRSRYSPGYYAAFVLDPDGHNTEAVLHEGNTNTEPFGSSTTRGPGVEDWVERYVEAWRTPGTAAVADLFADDATYRPAPFDDALRGIKAIKQFWSAERGSADERFTIASELVATTGGRSVVRLEVRYEHPPRTYRDLWIVEHGADGRCTAFEEWPFHPASTRVAPDGA